jgi:translation initiation factor 5B
VKIEPKADQAHVMIGRQFDVSNLLYSKLTRKSIDLLKANFKDDLGKDDWRLVIKMKKIFAIA